MEQQPVASLFGLQEGLGRLLWKQDSGDRQNKGCLREAGSDGSSPAGVSWDERGRALGVRQSCPHRGLRLPVEYTR